MSSVDAATLNPSLAFKVWWQGVAVVGAWLAVALLISFWPNATRNWPMTQGLANLCVGIAGLYVVGAGAHPGAGLPGVVSSAKTLDHLVPEPVSVL